LIQSIQMMENRLSAQFLSFVKSFTSFVNYLSNRKSYDDNPLKELTDL
jgi:hypothetical protein